MWCGLCLWGRELQVIYEQAGRQAGRLHYIESNVIDVCKLKVPHCMQLHGPPSYSCFLYLPSFRLDGWHNNILSVFLFFLKSIGLHNLRVDRCRCTCSPASKAKRRSHKTERRSLVHHGGGVIGIWMNNIRIIYDSIAFSLNFSFLEDIKEKQNLSFFRWFGSCC